MQVLEYNTLLWTQDASLKQLKNWRAEESNSFKFPRLIMIILEKTSKQWLLRSKKILILLNSLEFWSTMMTKGIYCNYLLNPWKTDQLFSLKLYKEKTIKDSEQGISKVFLKLLKMNRREEEIWLKIMKRNWWSDNLFI